MRAAILLAAGSSRRFGRANKLLQPMPGGPLIVRALNVACTAPIGRVIVVTGHQADRVARAIGRRRRVTLVHARDHRKGVSASLRAGFASLRPREREVFIFLGDMPNVPLTMAGRLARALGPGIEAVRPRVGAVPGHPLLMRRPRRDQLAALTGDRGFASVFDPARMRWIETTRRALRDIDRRGDVQRH